MVIDGTRSTGERPPGRPIEVLHVDDDAAFAETAARLLERADGEIAVETVTDGETALDRLSDGRFDCVVSDHEMPGRTGLELLSAARERRPELPFLLFTGDDSEGLARRAIDAGATDLVRKEAGPGTERYAVLANRIRTAVEAAGRRRERRRRQELFERLQAAADAGAWEYDVRSGELWWTEGLHELTGVPAEVEPTVERALECCLPADREILRDSLERAVSGERLDDLTVRLDDGDDDPRWVRIDVEPETVDGEVVRLRGTVRDVTERRELAAELERERSLLDVIFDRIPAHLFVKDREGRHLRVSGYVSETEGRAGRDGDRDETLILLGGEHQREEVLGKRDVDIVDSEHAEEAYEDDLRVIETGEPVVRKEEYADGADEWNLTSKVPWRDSDGEVVGLIGISQRITDRKRTERELERKNDRLERFASVLSHDLRNPLNVAAGRLELARAADAGPDGADGGDERADHLAAAREAIDRSLSLVEDLLALAREGRDVDPEPVDLATVATESWRAVETGDATLAATLDRTVRADRSRLRQLFENLLANAADHGGSTVSVGPLADGFYVADDGPGVPVDEREAVFEAGYTTDADGTGLGLWIVADVAEAHGWDLSVTEGGDGGARFEVRGLAFVD